MAAKKDTKDRSMFLRFNAETESVIDRIKRLLGNRGVSISDTEVVRRLIDEGALRLEIKDQMGLHEDLEKLQGNPRLGMLNIQARERAGESLSLVELVFMTRYWSEAYGHNGVRRREWVRKEPVAALYKMLYWLVQHQPKTGESLFTDQHTYFFEQWGKSGELVIPDPTAGMPGDRWVTPALAKHICQLLTEAVESAAPADMEHLNWKLGRDARKTNLQTALYGYWVSHKSSVLDGPFDEQSFTEFLTPVVIDDFRVDPILTGNRFSCGVSKTSSWIFTLGWVDWIELNEVISLSKDGSWDARAGRYTLFSPIPVDKTGGYTLDIEGVRLFLGREEFSQFQEILKRVSGDYKMLVFADRAKDIYGQI